MRSDDYTDQFDEEVEKLSSNASMSIEQNKSPPVSVPIEILPKHSNRDIAETLKPSAVKAE